MAEPIDILIIGGGLTGATLMLALRGHGYSTMLVEANSFTNKVSPDFDARTLALSPASVCILQMLAVWPLLVNNATPIDTIHVSEQGRLGHAILSNDADNSLGFVVEMQHINRALHQLLPKESILAPAKLISLDVTTKLAGILHKGKERLFQARLIVAADGVHSTVRRLSGLTIHTKEYQQEAIIANIGLSRSHANCAYERFTPAGPLAMLPMSGNRASLVWALPKEEAELLAVIKEQEFLKQLQKAFGYRLGRLNKVGERFIYPLRQAIMPLQTDWPLVFVGNAAHTLHPVAGQGFNLGLRDVATLAQCIIQYGLNPDMLIQYQSMRRYDQLAITKFTDTLVNVFTYRLPGLGILRGLGLLAVDTMGGLKKILTHHAGGFSGRMPDLACGIDLRGEGDDRAI